MSDVLAKRHSGNGMVEYGQFLLVDATVDKQLISFRLNQLRCSLRVVPEEG